MSDAPEAPKPKKKGGMMKKLILFVVLPLVLIGGGAGVGLVAARSMGGGEAKSHEDPNRPKLMKKVAGEHASGGGEEGGHGGGEASTPKGEPVEGPAPAKMDPSYYQATYFPMEQPFTSNLRDTDGFLQVGLGVSTFYDSRVIDHLKQAQMPVRSAILETLSAQSAEQLNTPEGKAHLRAALKDAINKVLTEQSGFGGIEGVYFTTFVIQ